VGSGFKLIKNKSVLNLGGWLNGLIFSILFLFIGILKRTLGILSWPSNHEDPLMVKLDKI
jgi:hypothetical protein